MRPLLLKMLHKHSCPEEDFEKFAVRFGEWNLTPILVKCEVAGVLVEKEGEIHMVLEPFYRKRSIYWRKGLKGLIQPLIEKYGYVTTTVLKENEETHAFVQKLGFKSTDSSNIFTYYLMEKIVHRRKECQQLS